MSQWMTRTQSTEPPSFAVNLVKFLIEGVLAWGWFIFLHFALNEKNTFGSGAFRIDATAYDFCRNPQDYFEGAVICPNKEMSTAATTVFVAYIFWAVYGGTWTVISVYTWYKFGVPFHP